MPDKIPYNGIMRDLFLYYILGLFLLDYTENISVVYGFKILAILYPAEKKIVRQMNQGFDAGIGKKRYL